MKNWSISKLQMYEECAKRVKLRYIDYIKPPEPDPESKSGKAILRGREVHKGAEDYVKGTIHDLPKPLAKYYEQEFQQLRKLYEAGKVSMEWKCGLDKDWNYVDNWDDAWCILAMDADVNITSEAGLVIDFKTGNPDYSKMKHVDQTRLYAITKFVKQPELQDIQTENWYVDYGKEHLRVINYNRKQVFKFIAGFDRRATIMMRDPIYKPKPSKWACRFCPYGPGDDKMNVCEDGIEVT